jgi:hypothetical protein
VLGAFLFRHRDPVLPQKHYDWEIGNEENPDDDAVG